MGDYIPLQLAHEPDFETFGVEAEPEDDCEPEEGYHCPWCDKDHQTAEHIRICSGWQPSGMPPNGTGHPYGCGCPDCMDEYRQLK